MLLSAVHKELVDRRITLLGEVDYEAKLLMWKVTLRVQRLHLSIQVKSMKLFVVSILEPVIYKCVWLEIEKLFILKITILVWTH